MSPAANLPPVSMTPAVNFATSSPCVVDTGGKFAAGVIDTGANNWNNIRLHTPESELEGKNLYICLLYYPKVTKQNHENFSD